MRTDDLIEVLVQDAKSDSKSIGQTLAIALVTGVGVSTLLFLILLGPRADFSEALATPWYPLKIVVLAGLGLAVLPIVDALLRPGARVPAAMPLLPVLLLSLAVTADLAIGGMSGAQMRLVGTNALYCLSFVSLFGAAPLAATLIAMRSGAAIYPGRAGFAAGVLSGAIGGVLYGLHCPDDSPLFVATWYTLAISGIAVAGALAGRLTLRW